MKTLYRAAIIASIVALQTGIAFGRDHNAGFDRAQSRSDYNPEIVNWTGTVHSILDNEVELEFIRKTDGKKFDIVESSAEFQSLDWENHQARVVKIEAEKTPRFLFWGGNLIVKKFDVLKDAGRYKMPKKVVRNVEREFHGRER